MKATIKLELRAEFDTLTYSNLKPIRLSNGKSYHLITNERTKTSVTYKIPIVSEIVMNLLGTGEPVQKIFSPLTNQPTNRYLKEIMKDMKIEKTMTFHMRRHMNFSFRLKTSKLQE